MEADEPLPKIEVMRYAAGITQKTLAEMIDKTEHSYRNWVKGRHIPRFTVYEMKILCRELDCSLADLPDDFSEV